MKKFFNTILEQRKKIDLAALKLFAIKLLKAFLFVAISSELIYLIIHLQFLFGIPQASLSKLDVEFTLLLGIFSYLLAHGNKKRYFIVLILFLFPIYQFQYFYITIFNKAFWLSEMKNYPTLIQVSDWPDRLLYLGSFGIWLYGVAYVIWFNIKYILENKKQLITFLVKLPILIYLTISVHTTLNETREMAPWMGDYRETFFMSGIVKTIQTRERNTLTVIPEEEVQKSYKFLKNLENTRKEYPISASPTKAPEKKKAIFVIIMESFYDFRDLYPLFGENNPFPKEYLDLVTENTYTGPNQNHGSFLARMVALTASYPLQLLNESRPHPYTFPYELKKHGYTSYVLEAVTPTYNLPKIYKNWFVDHEEYCLFGDDWSGKRLDPYRFEERTIERIKQTPDNVTPFYFMFTFLGHSRTGRFTDKLEDPEHLDEYLKYFNDDKEKLAGKRQLKGSIFNARRLVYLKNEILKKYPDALIVFKSDHLSFETPQNINNSLLPQEYKNAMSKNPAPLPMIMIDGQKGRVDLPKGISPGNLPLILMAKAGIPYKDTLMSLFYIENDTQVMNIYGKVFDKKTGIPLADTNAKYQEIMPKNKAVENISIDLYKGNSYSTNLMQ
ncbi:MAG: hypothetical protein ACRCS8_01700 [Brevinema sp.]